MTFALRGMAAHFVASCAASIFILVSIAGVQGLVLAVTGPRLFARVSPLLQLALVLAIGLAVFTLPGITSAVVDTLKIASHSGELIPLAKLSALARDVGPPNYRPWILNTPPLWFLGLYEWLLGGPGPLLAGFARTALVALASAVGVTIAAYSIAYRRVLVTMVEEAAGFGRVGRSARAIAWLSAIIARRPRQRAIAQFFLTTIARGDRQRFAMAISLGAAVALSLPTAVHWVALWPHPPQRPEVDLLTLPMVMTFVVLVGMRVAASLPSDLKAAWLFDVLAPRPSDVRAVMERAMFILVVLPAIVVFLPIHWRLWGARVGLTHVVLALGIGFFQIQLLLSRAGGMPCTQGWRPERAKLRTWWPWYFLGFLWFATGMRLESRSAGSALEMLLLQVPPVGSVFLIIFLIAGAVLRRRSMARLADPVDVLEPSGVVEILSLNQR
jgi:hypothetical protein